MIVFLNSEFVAEEQARVSVLDRGFLYGDGVFETLRVYEGRPFRWQDHMERLRQGAAFLDIPVPLDAGEFRERARELIERNAMPESVMRVTLSRGIGKRGYSPLGADRPTLVMTLHPVPEAAAGELHVITSSIALPRNDPLAAFKTCNKLPQVLARAEADARGAEEALLLNADGEAIEAAAANLFWIRDGMVCTPPLSAGILPGVTRAVVLELCRETGLTAREGAITPAGLRRADGVFLTLSSRGVVEVTALDWETLGHAELTGRIRAAYAEKVLRG